MTLLDECPGSCPYPSCRRGAGGRRFGRFRARGEDPPGCGDGAPKRGCDRIEPLTDDGVLSLDFLAGFTIFLLALIMVMGMVPGLLTGLDSSGIDYDAVAYRTGVILVEDPGWPASPGWEFKDAEHKDEIERMGLAVSRETPNILLSTKVEKFFNESFFDADDYRSKVIFGGFLHYSYNISLRSLDGRYDKRIGDPLPPGYGYIRRVVKIREPGVAVIDWSADSTHLTDSSAVATQTFIVRLNFSQMLNQTISPAYRIDPGIEPVNVTITNLNAYQNSTTGGVILRHIGFQKAEAFDMLSECATIDPGLYTLYIDGAPHNLAPGARVTEGISLVLAPAAVSLFNLDENSILDIRFTFENATIAGTHHYDYTNARPPPLKPAVLEVAIW